MPWDPDDGLLEATRRTRMVGRRGLRGGEVTEKGEMVIGWLCRRTIIVFAQGCDTCKTPKTSQVVPPSIPRRLPTAKGSSFKLTQENTHSSSHATDGGMENRNGSLAFAADWKTGVGKRSSNKFRPLSLCSLYIPRSPPHAIERVVSSEHQWRGHHIDSRHYYF